MKSIVNSLSRSERIVAIIFLSIILPAAISLAIGVIINGAPNF